MDNIITFTLPSLSFSHGALACIHIMASPFILGISTKLKFYDIGLSVLCPTTSNPGGLMSCFFVWSFTTNLPGMRGPNTSYATASIAWWITKTHKPHHHLSVLLPLRGDIIKMAFLNPEAEKFGTILQKNKAL